MNRRHFMKNAAIVSTASLLPVTSVLDNFKGLKKIGVQLFSLPRLLEKDFKAGIQMLSKMGYKEVELYGPFTFSTKSAQDRWNAVTPMLGFSGSGYFGHTAQEVKSILKENGISSPSMHTDLDTLQNSMGKLGDAAHLMGHKYVVLPAIPDEKRKTLDDYKRIADDFNKIGENAKKEGIKFAYHNHGYGIREMNGKIPLQIIFDNTDPQFVFFEMDIYWTAAGGADPIAYLEKYPNRYHLMHVKDMKEKKKFSGDGGDAGQWIPLFPYMTSAGSGVLGVKSIIEKGKQTGVKHFFVEQDMVADPEISLKQSFDYLKGL
jgi:sugar phosphate isomerase/epimerase